MKNHPIRRTVRSYNLRLRTRQGNTPRTARNRYTDRPASRTAVRSFRKGGLQILRFRYKCRIRTQRLRSFANNILYKDRNHRSVLPHRKSCDTMDIGAPHLQNYCPLRSKQDIRTHGVRLVPDSTHRNLRTYRTEKNRRIPRICRICRTATLDSRRNRGSVRILFRRDTNYRRVRYNVRSGCRGRYSIPNKLLHYLHTRSRRRSSRHSTDSAVPP